MYDVWKAEAAAGISLERTSIGAETTEELFN